MIKATSVTIRQATRASIAAVCLAVSVWAPMANAATAQSFQISPPTSNYSANPGATVRGVVKVTNLTDQPISLAVDKQNFAAKGEEGEVELIDNADPLYSLAPWFNVLQPNVDVAARATKEVPYSISIPANAEPGGRYGALVFHTIAARLPVGQSGAAVEQDIVALIFVRINGAANEQLNVTSFQTGTRVNADTFNVKDFFEYGPVDFLARIKNTGTVHEKATGTITIKNMLGIQIAKFPLDEHFVIPGSIRRLHNSWPTGTHKPVLFGHYTATMTANYAGGKTITATTSFTVLPWKILVAVFIILVLIFLIVWRGRKRLSRAARILAGRE